MLRARPALAALAAVAALALTSSPAAAEAPAAEPAIDLLSAAPKFAVIDAYTGQVMSVVPTSSGLSSLEPAPTPPAITNTHICLSPASACFYSGRVPWADQGFHGTPGTIRGVWPFRNGGYSGRYTVTFTWVGNTPKKTVSVGPDTGFRFASGGGTPVQVEGRSVRIH
jgi:hypothetical protein